MSSKNWKLCFFAAFLLAVAGCVDQYRPPEIAAPNRYLVVDGFLNGGPGPTVIKLSRTRNISEVRKSSAETKATVQVEGERSGILRMTETATGTYTLNIALNRSERYRLRIRTSNNVEYLSDYVPIKQTPAIESVTWTPGSNALQILVNTRDQSNNTRYYRWEYEDTYELRTPYMPGLEFFGGKIQTRPADRPDITTCWRTEPSTEIIVGTTERLTQDVLVKQPLTLVSYNIPKLYIRYSILVRQYALTKEAYEYWDNLRKNTEQLGSLFDPLPSQIPGNIRCITNPGEPVLGFISGHTVTEKRLFIHHSELPAEIRVPSGYEACAIDTVEAKDQIGSINAGMLPISTTDGMAYVPGVDILMSNKVCVDCRERGTNVRPSFW